MERAGRVGRTPAAGSIAPVTLTAAADGSALGNPGPAGWGWYIDENRWAAGGWPHGTNNQGELTAVLDLLQQTAHTAEDLVILCDSRYAIDSITQWMAGWKRRGWRKADGKPVKNVEVMQALDLAMTQARAAGRRIRFEWVKGHAGHRLNEEADRLANGAACAYQAGSAPDPGPGIPGATRISHDVPGRFADPRGPVGASGSDDTSGPDGRRPTGSDDTSRPDGRGPTSHRHSGGRPHPGSHSEEEPPALFG